MEWIFRGKPTVLGACSGVVAGLVCITPASGYVTPMSALLMGVAVGVVCYLACTALKSRFGYDDSLDAFGVHGVGGTLGAIAHRRLRHPAPPGDLRLRRQAAGPARRRPVLKAQIVAVVITWGLAIVGTFVILKVLDAMMGLRVSREAEIEGLDFSQHGEEGYIFI